MRRDVSTGSCESIAAAEIAHGAYEKFMSLPAVYADAIPFLTGPEGVGLEKAPAGYAEWIEKVWLPG